MTKESGRSAIADGLSSSGSSQQAVSPLRASIPSAVEIPNPIRWFYQIDNEAEWWHRGGPSREEALDKGIEQYGGEPFFVAECKLLLPRFSIFDADDICERLSEDDEAWWEDGWTGEPLPPAKRILEKRLEETFKQWFAEFATLDGACLDQICEERIDAQAIEARRAETERLGAQHESAVGETDAPKTPKE